MRNSEILGLIEFIAKAEKLKTELRHSWTSDTSRQESVAEHTWMLTLMALVLPDTLELDVDRDRVIRLLIIHDLAEVITGDIPPFEKHSKELEDKYAREKAALETLTESLPPKLQDEIIELWEEMEANKTLEAKVAQCIDKSEVLIQHNLADISTWDQDDYDIGIYHKDEYFDLTDSLRAFRDVVNLRNAQKLTQAGTLDRLPKEQQNRIETENL